MDPGTFKKTAVSKHSLSLPLQMQVKTLPYKVTAIYQQHPKTLLTTLGPNSELTQSGKVCCGLTSPHFKLFSEIIDVVTAGLKR